MRNRDEDIEEVSFGIAPDRFREMAGWIINECVGGTPSTGGFITWNISNTINYLTSPMVTWPLWETYRMI